MLPQLSLLCLTFFRNFIPYKICPLGNLYYICTELTGRLRLLDIKKISIYHPFMANISKFQDRLVGEQRNMLNFAYRLTSDHNAASDLVQETTLKALDNEEKYADNVNFKGWLFTIMRNIFINNYRRNVRQSTMVDTTDNLYHLNSCAEAVNESPEGAYTISEISELISRLPDTFREPFSLHVAGYKYEEIAEKLQLPLGTVKSRIFTTRRQLRELLTDYHY